MNSYQWYKNGAAISGANFVSYDVYEHGEYWVELTNNSLCSNVSDSIYIYMNSLPKAEIIAERSLCAYPSSTANFFLSTDYDVNYTYVWSSNPTGASFSPPNSYSTYASLLLPAVLPVTYEFIVTVTDIVTNCHNNDTICITFLEKPVVNVPFLSSCEGYSTTLIPNPIDTNYHYLWSNGATTPVITTSNPGFYSLTITDKVQDVQLLLMPGLFLKNPI